MLWLLLLGTIVSQASASNGDRSPSFRKCVHVCHETGCTVDGDLSYYAPLECADSCGRDPVPGSALAWSLRLMQWDCLGDCKYRCMQEQSERRRKQSLDLYKYYGKWPFTRVLGVQELCSSGFSVLILLAHVDCFRRLSRKIHVRP
mmetsp:Transcript_3111/g.11282  ORF Transcript_3111/g.11282 Transcript_3111/m.11282 type:complete len:146 (+) Transcript_3111:3-440(+)